jgi:WD40 repeat protein
VDDICTRFELAWKRGDRPRIEDYLDDSADVERPALLAEMVLLDLDYRRSLGEGCKAGDYRDRFPGLDPAWLDRAIAAASAASADPGAGRGPASTWPETAVPPGSGDVRSRSFGDYSLTREIARGGMGVVYEAWQVGLERRVAVKMILAGAHASRDHLARFRTEARAVARLQHPHIVQVHEVGTHDGRPYLVLEYVAGGNLADHLGGRPQTAKDAARLVETLARAVHFAHEQGVVHRDLKPANILLTADGTPKIADFGLARCLDLDGGSTGTADVIGTPSFMAPEQAMGRGRAVGAAADVYALGAILYQMLTGRPPLVAPTPLETFQLVASEEPVPPRSLQRGLPRDLETICLMCLQKDPSRRYASAGDLADDLDRFLNDRPILARPAGLGERGWRWCRRNPAMATLTASVSVLLVVAVLVAVWLGRERAAALGLLRRAEDAERDRTEQLWKSAVARARAERLSHRVGQRFGSLKALKEAATLARELGKPPAAFDEMRNEAIASLAVVDLRPRVDWTFQPAGERAVYDSALATCASYVDDRGTIVVQRTGDGSEIHRLEGFLQDFAFLRFSPDGRFLATGNNHRLRAWRLSPGPPRLFYDDAAEVPFRGVEPWIVSLFSPDSRRMILPRAGDKTLRVYDLEAGRLARSISLGEFVEYGVFHPGSRLVAVGLRETIQVWDIESGHQVGRTFPHLGAKRPLAWSPDGSMLVTCPGSDDLRVWSMPDGGLLHRLTHRGGGTMAAFDPSGEILYTGSSWVPSLRLWHARTGRLLLADDRFFSPDVFAATACLVGGKRRELVEVATAREYRAFASDSPAELSYLQPSIDPSGRLLVVPEGQALEFWELAGGTRLGKIVDMHMQGRGPFFDGSGDLWTNGVGGLLNWPVRAGEDGAVHLGPPDRLATRPMDSHDLSVSSSRDGRVVAVANYEGAVVLDRDQPGRGIWLGPQADCRNVAVSPDGRYVLTRSQNFYKDHDPPPSSVWDARSGRRLKDFDRDDQSGFTGDGLRLLAEGRFWRLGSWEPGPTVDVGGGSFAEGAGLCTSGTGPVVSLVSVATGREVARLEDPNQEAATFRTFTRDGTRLFTTSRQGESIHAWDLRLIRLRLAELGLDWEAPPFPPEAPRPDPPPRRLVVDFGSMEPLLDDPQRLLTRYSVALTSRPRDAEAFHRRALVKDRLKRWEEALVDAQAAAELAPRDRRAWFLVGRIQLKLGRLDEAVTSLRQAIDCSARPGDHPVELAEASLLNEAARRCVIDPSRVREPGRVLPLISAAIEILPLPSYRSTLGVAYYRLGGHRDAVACFEQSLDQQSRGNRVVVLYFLAMSYHRAGDSAKARAIFDRVVDLQGRIDFGPPDLVKISAYRAEAERTLAE